MVNHLIIFIIIIFISFVTPINATIINVPGNQPTIQAGINAASTGDTVLVAQNTYYENINFLGKGIVVASHYILNKDATYITSTIINGSNPTYPDSASCVSFKSGEDSTSVLQGFTITGGTGTKWVDPNNPSYTWRGGGGVFTFTTSPVIRNNLIIYNEVTNTSGVNGAQGGGTLSYGGNPLILNNVIMMNEARYGAGIVIDYSGGIIKNNIIYKNTGGQDYGGGGFWSIGNGAHPIILENNHIVENSVTGSGSYGGKGGAMFVWMGTVTALNNIIWGNTQSHGGPIAEISGYALISYSNVEGGFTGTGNININPSFSDTNFYLSELSPCIDTGNPGSVYYDPEDPNNPNNALWPSRGGLRNDMGAYGGPLRDLFPIFNPVSIKSVYTLLSTDFLLFQNYPNPFNPVTTIEYDLTKRVKVELILYDLLGQEVRTLVSEKQNSGRKSVVWDGKDNNGRIVSSGVYIYILKTEDYLQSKKMIFIK